MLLWPVNVGRILIVIQRVVPIVRFILWRAIALSSFGSEELTSLILIENRHVLSPKSLRGGPLLELGILELLSVIVGLELFLLD